MIVRTAEQYGEQRTLDLGLGVVEESRSVSSTPQVDALLLNSAPVAISVSGGKDSVAAAFAALRYLEAIDHRGPRLLIHAHLGRIEWTDSLATCRRLADRLGVELVVVERTAGDMVDRWYSRWQANCERYRHLQCVKLILPWSTAAMRFCTSELKTAIISRELVRRFPGKTILSVTGIRRQESAARARTPVAVPATLLTRSRRGTTGWNWHPILDWSEAEVFAEMACQHFAPHEAYTVYGSSRVSCAFCVLASQADLHASVRATDNQAVYRELVDLEIRSTFAFQEGKWLADVAPYLLCAGDREALEDARRRARVRERAEARIPSHLLFARGWPHVRPTLSEARLLAEVRSVVAEAVGLDILYTHPDAVAERYEQLLALKSSLDVPNSQTLPIRELWHD